MDGNCNCKPGVTGQNCDECEINHWNFGPFGCESCGCKIGGSLNNVPQCDSDTGQCVCKPNVEGKQCESCSNGYYHDQDGPMANCIPFEDLSIRDTCQAYIEGMTKVLDRLIFNNIHIFQPLLK